MSYRPPRTTNSLQLASDRHGKSSLLDTLGETLEGSSNDSTLACAYLGVLPIKTQFEMNRARLHTLKEQILKNQQDHQEHLIQEEKKALFIKGLLG